MGDSTRSTTPTRTPVTHYYSVLGIPKTASLKEISKAYKSLVMKWHPDRNTSNRAEAEDKFTTINEAYRVLSSNKKEEANKCIPKTPKKIKHRHKDEIIISNPTLLSSTSTRVTPRSTTPTPSEYSEHSEFSDFSKCSTRRSKTPTPSSSSADFLASSSINLGGPTTQEAAILSKMASRRGSAPIFYSHSTSTTRRKPPPVEKKLRCTLEELCHGCVKKIKITRNTFSPFGAIVEEEEMLTIKVKPGWKKGTKVTFEGKGDEQPGTLPADIIFVIDEKRHHLFKRDGDNLDLGVEVPLVQALTGCTITVPLLGGGEMNLSFEDILYPGYEKIIPGEGMPKPKEAGKRGDLRLRFLVEFPKGLSDEQRADIVRILEEEEEDES